MKKLIYTLLFLFAVQGVIAQQTGLYDHYLVQPYLLNPAAAGANGNNIFVDYRKQWAGFVGSPETQVLTIDGTIKKESMGLGLTIQNDQVNIIGSLNAMATYAYRVKFDEGHFLRFGLSLGISQNRINFSRVIAEDPNELQIFQNNQNATSIINSGGIYYQLQKFQLGFAATYLLGGNFYYENNFNQGSLHFQNIQHYLVNAQYRFDFKDDKWGLMPSAQIRSVQGMKIYYEGGVTGYYKNKMWLTARYSHKVGMSAGFGGIINKNITLGYAYSFTMNELSGYNLGSHDIIIGFKIGSGGKGSSTDEKELHDLKKMNNELFEKTDYLKNENEQLRKEVDEQKKLLKEAIYGLDSLKKNYGVNQEELEKLIRENSNKFENYDGDKNGDKNHNSDNKNGSGNGINPDVVESVTNGQVYVVVGAVTKLDGAKLLQKIIKREYGEDTYVVQDDVGFWYFVYTKSFDNKNEAIEERNRADKMDSKSVFIGDPWFYISNKK